MHRRDEEAYAEKASRKKHIKNHEANRYMLMAIAAGGFPTSNLTTASNEFRSSFLYIYLLGIP